MSKKEVKNKCYLGIDLGLSGGISLVDEDDNLLCLPMPIYKIIVNKKVKNQYNINEIWNYFSDLLMEFNIQSAIFERVRNFPGQSSQTGFSLGYGTALFETVFTSLNIPYQIIEPQKWQKEMFKGINYTKDETKIASVMAAKKLWPKAKFTLTERSSKASDGLTDSALMAIYLKRQLN